MSDGVFDEEAKFYDQNFTHTEIGKLQRAQVWKLADAIQIASKNSVLEINCGTGEDAHYWIKRTAHYLGTDASPEMIRQAQLKVPKAKFTTCSFQEINKIEGQYDLIFSNFGGINCIDATELTHLFQQLSVRLKPKGKIVLVIMGKKCIWDNFYSMMKGKFSQIGRRNTQLPVSVPIKNEVVKTWYFSPKQVRKLGSTLQVKLIKPIGLFVPPSYMSPYFERHPRQLSFLNWLDKIFVATVFANYADHFYIELEKA